MIAPDPLPFHPEPRGELFHSRRGEFRLQRRGADPAPGVDLPWIAHHRLTRAADVNRTQLLLAAVGIKARLVLKLKQILQRAADAELLAQPPSRRHLQRFRASRMAAAAVGPVKRPQSLA